MRDSDFVVTRRGATEATEHTADFFGVGVKLLVVYGSEKTLVAGNGGLSDNFEKRSGGVAEESAKIGRWAGGTFGNVGRN